MFKIYMPKKVEGVLNTLHMAGFEAYIVGGCVRDSLLKREPHDWDVTTNATPEQVKNIFPETLDTGIKHGTVTIKDGMIEVTTYRIDGEYSDGRHPDTVTFTSSLKEDLRRRDFTINAMAYNAEEGLVDYFGGQDDIVHKTIRCVGDPEDRFTEDALRMLRAIRFAAQLGFDIETDTYTTILRLASSITQVSKERIGEEIRKIFQSPNPDAFLYIKHTWLGKHIFSGVYNILYSANFSGMSWLTCMALAFRCCSDWDKLKDALKLSNYEIKYISEFSELLGEYWPLRKRDIPYFLGELYQRLNVHDKSELPALIKEFFAYASHCDLLATPENACLAAEYLPFLTSDLKITGTDLLELGVPEGPQMRTILHALLRMVIEDSQKNRRSILIEEATKLRDLYAKMDGPVEF